MKTIIAHFLAITVLAVAIDARLLDIQSKRVIALKDGTSVMLLNSVDEPTAFYYLPLDIQLSQNRGIPEISLMVYRNEENQITGGVLHVLMTWGLTPQQEQEAQSIIRQKIDSTGTLRGAADITFEPGELQFDQRNVFGRGLERSSSASIRISPLPMHKTAASFDLSPLVARFLLDELNAIDQSPKILMKATYQYAVSTRQNLARTPVVMHGEMHTALDAWIKVIRQHKLMKIVHV